MSAPIRLGMLGVQHSHAPGKIRWLLDLPDIDFVGAYEPNTAVRAERENEPRSHGVRWRDDIQSILSDDALAGVVIGGEERQNPSYARRALAAGKHVLMEKACGWTRAHADELIGTAEREGLLFQMGYNFRLLPHIRRILDMNDAGAFGQVFRVRVHQSAAYQGHPATQVDGSPYFRGGIFYNLACHALDLVIAVLGAPDRVHGFLRCDAYGDPDFVDNATVVLEFADAIAVIESSFLETEQRRPRGLEVYGLEATAIASPFSPVADLAPAVAIHTGGVAAGADGWRRYGAEPFEPFRADIEEFVACIRGEKRPRFNYEHDRTVHHTLMQICGESEVAEIEA